MSLSTRYPVRVEWGDCDPAEIVFYPHYFRWMDAATWHLFDAAGGGWERLHQRFGLFRLPLLAADCNFKSPSRQGDSLIVESRVDSWQRKVLTVRHDIYGNGSVVAGGIETRCWATGDGRGGQSLRAAPIPAEVIDLFAGAKTAPATPPKR